MSYVACRLSLIYNCDCDARALRLYDGLANPRNEHCIIYESVLNCDCAAMKIAAHAHRSRTCKLTFFLATPLIITLISQHHGVFRYSLKCQFFDDKTRQMTKLKISTFCICCKFAAIWNASVTQLNRIVP
jgi:hypothetical protein